jgi:hypothetical protein
MREVVDDVARIREKCMRYQHALAQRFEKRVTDPPIGGFGMGMNESTVTLELVHHYWSMWGKLVPQVGDDVERIRQENSERVVLVTRNMLVSCLSGYEFSAKQAIAEYPTILRPQGGRLYLGRILKASHDCGLVHENALALWEGALEARNTLVHNNGIAERTVDYRYPMTVLRFNAGQMMQGDLRTMAAVTEWVVDAFADWTTAFLVAAQR